jgi:hypothetical protein
MNYIGKTEFFNKDILPLRERLSGYLAERLNNIINDPLNASSKQHEISFDNGTIKRVRKIYEFDFELFGYDRWSDETSIKNLLNQRK